jgi:hypothetical protein|tara:strand:+ start:415 stop:729 length:315 start_codon:yes stop_codon:yes gene_type:complete
MAYYKNITTDADNVIIPKGNPGIVSKLLVTNKHDTLSTTITLYIKDVVTAGGPYSYVILKTKIPAKASFLISEKELMSYDGSLHEMRFITDTVGGTATIDLIIK